MTTQPKPSQFSIGDEPAPPSGTARVKHWMASITTGGLMIAGGLYLANNFLPYHLKPAVVLGEAGGWMFKAELDTMGDTRIVFDRRDEDAKAQAHAKAQADLIAIQAVLNERTESLHPVSVIAGFADVLCLGSSAIAGMTQESAYRSMAYNNHDGSIGYNTVARTVAMGACGQGDAARRAVTQSQIEAIRTIAAARGMPMDDGAVPVTRAAAPVPDTGLERRALQAIDAVKTASGHYADMYVDQARTWTETLPRNVRDHIYDDYPDRDVVVDRALALSAVYYPETTSKTLPHIEAPAPDPAPVQPVKVTTARVEAAAAKPGPAPVHAKAAPVQATPTPAAPSRYTAAQQGQLRAYSYSMPVDVLRRVSAGTNMRGGYTDGWYDQVASYRAAHQG